MSVKTKLSTLNPKEIESGLVRTCNHCGVSFTVPVENLPENFLALGDKLWRTLCLTCSTLVGVVDKPRQRNNTGTYTQNKYKMSNL